VIGRHPAERSGTQRDADGGADEREEPCNLHGVPEFPQRCSLNEYCKRGDERRALRGRNDVQPESRSDEAKSEPRDAGHDGAEERRNEEEREIHWDCSRHDDHAKV
jgi:hypothetical protein